MTTVARMLRKEIITTVAMTALAFLALLMFFDLISESRFVSRTGVQTYGAPQALAHLAMSAPMHLYELLPICVLIGSIFVMVRYARTSQFTILRTSGLGPTRALGILLSIGLLFTAVTFVLGDYVAPLAERSAQLLRARHLGGEISGGSAGAWLRERQDDDSLIVSISALRTDGEIQGIRIMQFGPDRRLVKQTRAERAQVVEGGWQLVNAREELLPDGAVAPALQSDGSLSGEMQAMTVTQHAELLWPTTITDEMVNAAILKPDGMSTVQLVNYVTHLRANDQSAQRFELELWRKIFYPLGCLVMVVLALPFAYLHFRSGAMVGQMFIGILLGISYLMLNNVLGYVGNLRGWHPLLAAATPALLYTLLALAVFFRMVRQP